MPPDSMDPRMREAIASCARERIDLSGAIQPHGYLVSCDLAE